MAHLDILTPLVDLLVTEIITLLFVVVLLIKQVETQEKNGILAETFQIVVETMLVNMILIQTLMKQ
mgnify:CR=1 FL=1